jgi:hypothetical protein
MAEVIVRAIHNRTKEVVHYPTSSGSTIDVEPGQTVEGPFIVQYDETQEGEIPSPNEVWFVGSTDTFKWGTVEFWTPPD